MARKQVCPRDCPRRKVGCRSGCPDWVEHERRKTERYTAKEREYAAQPSLELKERRYRKKLREGLTR